MEISTIQNPDSVFELWTCDVIRPRTTWILLFWRQIGAGILILELERLFITQKKEAFYVWNLMAVFVILCPGYYNLQNLTTNKT